MKGMWLSTVKIYWDPWRNIPLIKPRQEEIDLVYQIKLSEPGDARPAFRGDYDRLREAIEYEFGSDKLYSEFIEGRFVLLNKVPHWDIMYEVVSSGNVVGQLYFDPYSSRWRFRLTYQGAYLAIHDGIVDYVRAKPPFYNERVLEVQTSTSSKQVVVTDEKGIIRGIGEVKGYDVTIVKVFHDRSMPVETSNKPATMDDVLRYNNEGIEQMEQGSTRFLQRLRKRYGETIKPVVSYSGGKDSLVALDLAHKAFGELEIIFNDTGLEMPETLRNVDEVTRLYNYELHIARAGDIFWKAVEVFGPPGKDYRWCCKVAKLVPIAKLTKTLWPTGALNIVGQRAYESLDRAKSSLIWRNKWIPHMISTTPIQYWSQLACWLYIYKNKLPYNKLYEEGFDRLGCYLCPSCALAEFRDVEKIYPELWIKWLNVLEKWRKRLELPDEWIKLGLWRWISPATAKKRVVHHLQGYAINWVNEYKRLLMESKVKLVPVQVAVTNKNIDIKFNETILTEDKLENYIYNVTNLGFKLVSKTPLILEKNNVKFEIVGDSLKSSSQNTHTFFEDLIDLVKIIYRIRGCVLCGSCVLWSKRGSVKLTTGGPLLQEQLDEKSMRVYIEVCPISDQLVEKIVIPLITGDNKSFKRKTRRKLIL